MRWNSNGGAVMVEQLKWNSGSGTVMVEQSKWSCEVEQEWENSEVER